MDDMEILGRMVRLAMAWEQDPENQAAYELEPELCGLTLAWGKAFPDGETASYEVLSLIRTWLLSNPLRVMRMLAGGLADEITQAVAVANSLKGVMLPCSLREALESDIWAQYVMKAEWLLPRTNEESKALRSLIKKFKAARLPC